MSRVRIQLSESLAASGASCTQLWWPVPPSPSPMRVIVNKVLAAVGLTSISLETINVTLSGFSVLLNSSTDVLRDGDLLEIDLKKQNKNKRKQPPLEGTATAAASPARKKAATADKIQETPAPDNGIVSVPLSGAGPSRSARRKAAKRLRKRQGFAVLPLLGRRHPQQQAAPTGRFKKTAFAAVEQDKLEDPQKKIYYSSLSSSSSEEESTEKDEEKNTPSSSSTTSTTSSDTSSASSSSSSSDEEEKNGNHTKSTLQIQAKLNRLFPILPLCNGMPAVGRVVAYKLLEIGEDFAPRISEARLGKVLFADTTQDMLIMEPYPDPKIHPLHSLLPTKTSDEKEGEEEEREPPPSNYDETGVLTAELGTFSELKYFVTDDGDDNGINIGKQQNVEKEVEEPLGPLNYSRLGPPPPGPSMLPMHPQRETGGIDSSPAAPIRDPEVLASLVAQLQQRRAELALKNTEEELSKEDGKPAAGEEQAAKAAAASAPVANGSRAQKNLRNPRHRGSMQSALGPMLRRLRNSEDL